MPKRDLVSEVTDHFYYEGKERGLLDYEYHDNANKAIHALVRGDPEKTLKLLEEERDKKLERILKRYNGLIDPLREMKRVGSGAKN